MKKIKKNQIFSLKTKLNAENFAKERIETIDINQSVLDVQYICDNSSNEVTATAYITGSVIAGDPIVQVNDKRINQSDDGKFILGDNKNLNNKKLYIVRTVTGEMGTNCVMTVSINGGYKDMRYHMSSKISGDELTFYFVAEFI